MKLRNDLWAIGPFAASILALAACGGGVETVGSGGATTTTTSTSTTDTTSTTSTSTSTSTSSSTTTTTTTSTSTSATVTDPTCVGAGSTTLPGVHIEFPSPQCTFSFADPVATVMIAYEIVVDADVAGVVAQPQDAGSCGKPGPSGLIPLEQVEGGGQNYCICSSGKCAPPSTVPVTLKKGVYPATFEWDRHNWNGPSDTGTPKGPLFPVGDYTLTVSAKGLVSAPDAETPFVVTGTLPIHLVP